MAKEGETVFSFRVPLDLFGKIEARAAKNRRSVNAEMLIMLERFVEAEERLAIPGGFQVP